MNTHDNEADDREMLRRHTDQERDLAEEAYNRGLLAHPDGEESQDPADYELDATAAREDRRNAWQDDVAEDPVGDGDYTLTREEVARRTAAGLNYNPTGRPDDEVPAAQAERDRLMPQACGSCGAEVEFDGAPLVHDEDCPRYIYQKLIAGQDRLPLADHDGEAEADAASQRAAFSTPVPGESGVLTPLVTEALARAVIALSGTSGQTEHQAPPAAPGPEPAPEPTAAPVSAEADREALDRIAALLRGEDPGLTPAGVRDAINDIVARTGRAVTGTG